MFFFSLSGKVTLDILRNLKANSTKFDVNLSLISYMWLDLHRYRITVIFMVTVPWIMQNKRIILTIKTIYPKWSCNMIQEDKVFTYESYFS